MEKSRLAQRNDELARLENRYNESVAELAELAEQVRRIEETQGR